MASAARTMEEIGADWVKLLERALQFDGWGQVVEAVEAYERYTVHRALTCTTGQCRSFVMLNHRGVLCLTNRLGSTIAANIDSVAPTKEIRVG